MAEILDNVNYLHPFREGNGRAQREFLRLLASEKSLTLNLNPPDIKSVYEKYMKGTIESDLTILTELIFELIDTEIEKNNEVWGSRFEVRGLRDEVRGARSEVREKKYEVDINRFGISKSVFLFVWLF